MPASAYASAGGGVGVGGLGGGFGGTHGDIVTPPWQLWASVALLLGVLWLLTTGVYLLKTLLVRLALQRLATIDQGWDTEVIERQARDAFESIQSGWSHEHLGSAGAHMTPDLRDRLAAKLDTIQRAHGHVVLRNLKLKRAAVVGLSAGPDPTADRVWVWFDAHALDYVRDDNGLLIDGSAAGPRRLREVWSFVRGTHGWIADSIDQKPHGVTTILLPQHVGARVGA